MAVMRYIGFRQMPTGLRDAKAKVELGGRIRMSTVNQLLTLAGLTQSEKRAKKFVRGIVENVSAFVVGGAYAMMKAMKKRTMSVAHAQTGLSIRGVLLVGEYRERRRKHRLRGERGTNRTGGVVEDGDASRDRQHTKPL